MIVAIVEDLLIDQVSKQFCGVKRFLGRREVCKYEFVVSACKDQTSATMDSALEYILNSS